tara:strand:+ start:4618 stop:4932 length:315 start_codon:yes stop_codon:yes gene_type:complete
MAAPLLAIAIPALVTGAIGLVGGKLQSDAAMDRLKEQQEQEQDMLSEQARLAPEDYFQPLPMTSTFAPISTPQTKSVDWSGMFGNQSMYPQLPSYGAPPPPPLY